MNFKNFITHNCINAIGWHTNKKIVMIESDDWGSIRMPSQSVLKTLLKQNVNFDLSIGYDKYDTIASASDLENLYSILDSVKDKNNNSAIITANCVVANPDFDKIKNCYYTEYHYELITETTKRFYPNNDPFKLWTEGFRKKIFIPQFHGREHMNVPFWLKLLKKNHIETMASFREHVFSHLIHIYDNRTHLLSSYNYKSKEDKAFVEKSIYEGVEIFERLFGYRSISAIAPCYVWDDFVEKCYQNAGIKFIQGSFFQTYPIYNKTKKRGKYHYLGEKNGLNQVYFIRNSFFEPSQYPNIDSVNECLSRISIAFKWHKPAIISSHRLNYVGALSINNRDNNLKQLLILLKAIIKKWPDVEFMSSNQLGVYIQKQT